MKLTPTAWRNGLLPIPRPMTPEEIYQDVLDAISMDIGAAVGGALTGSISGDIRTVTAVQRSPEFLNRKARRRRRALER